MAYTGDGDIFHDIVMSEQRFSFLIHKSWFRSMYVYCVSIFVNYKRDAKNNNTILHHHL